MWENILVTGLILNFGCNNSLLSEGHNMVSFQENSGSNTFYKNKLHIWIWMTTFGRSTKSWSLRSPQLHQQDKKYSERMIISKLRRMLLWTGQCNLTMVLKQLDGFLLAAHYCRNTSHVSERRQTFLFESLCTRLGSMESFYPFYVIMMCFSSEKRFSEVAVCRVFLCNLGLYWINPSVFEQCLFFIWRSVR